MDHRRGKFGRTAGRITLKKRKKKPHLENKKGSWQARERIWIRGEEISFPPSHELQTVGEVTERFPNFLVDTGMCHLSILLAVTWICSSCWCTAWTRFLMGCVLVERRNGAITLY